MKKVSIILGFILGIHLIESKSMDYDQCVKNGHEYTYVHLFSIVNETNANMIYHFDWTLTQIFSNGARGEPITWSNNSWSVDEKSKLNTSEIEIYSSINYTDITNHIYLKFRIHKGNLNKKYTDELFLRDQRTWSFYCFDRGEQSTYHSSRNRLEGKNVIYLDQNDPKSLDLSLNIERGCFSKVTQKETKCYRFMSPKDVNSFIKTKNETFGLLGRLTNQELYHRDIIYEIDLKNIKFAYVPWCNRHPCFNFITGEKSKTIDYYTEFCVPAEKTRFGGIYHLSTGPGAINKKNYAIEKGLEIRYLDVCHVWNKVRKLFMAPAFQELPNELKSVIIELYLILSPDNKGAQIGEVREQAIYVPGLPRYEWEKK